MISPRAVVRPGDGGRHGGLALKRVEGGGAGSTGHRVDQKILPLPATGDADGHFVEEEAGLIPAKDAAVNGVVGHSAIAPCIAVECFGAGRASSAGMVGTLGPGHQFVNPETLAKERGSPRAEALVLLEHARRAFCRPSSSALRRP